MSNACGIEEKFGSVTLLGTCERRVMLSREIFPSKDKENLEVDLVSERLALGIASGTRLGGAMKSKESGRKCV